MSQHRKSFFDRIRHSLFGGQLDQSQVDGIELVLDRWGVLKPSGDLRWLAYVLATVFHETARRFEPVREMLAETDEQAIARLERAYSRGQLGQVRTPYWRKDSDGLSWFGRGYVQITHKRNYIALAKLTGHPIDLDPSLALVPHIACDVLLQGMIAGAFTGRSLAGSFSADTSDWRGARRIINGLDKADLVAGYAKAFHHGLKAAETGQ